MLTACVLDSRTPTDNEPFAVAGARPTTELATLVDLEHRVAFIRQKVEPRDATLGKRGGLRLAPPVVNKNHVVRRISHTRRAV